MWYKKKKNSHPVTVVMNVKSNYRDQMCFWFQAINVFISAVKLGNMDSLCFGVGTWWSVEKLPPGKLQPRRVDVSHISINKRQNQPMTGVTFAVITCYKQFCSHVGCFEMFSRWLWGQKAHSHSVVICQNGKGTRPVSRERLLSSKWVWLAR